MYLIYSLVFVIALTLIFTDTIRKKAIAFYGISSIIAVLVTVYEILRLTSNYQLGGFIGTLERVFMRGNVSIAFFILVMFAGALNKKLKVTKKLMSIRAENAIMGSILIMPHCIMYFVRFLVKLSAGKRFTTLYFIYLVVGILAFILMIPLFITSFKKIRIKMNFSDWKRLQRKAYIFYLLAYVHIVVVLLNGKTIDFLKLITYTVIFLAYLILKLFRNRK
ncbi:ferric reductase-like transmembrane domain-containing protein [Clostridium baratii]|uniref:ferric reductase-like transmembrane domain-containing protein n=1 Tax=Clostridium baratii TaxID=1561 RepID=UPI001CB56A8B|nr:ferric reductase-like transmembrane domain-containing protein [Clostridium baratii]STA99854.1 membrane spanning protein [Clostridium baratii]